ncbi:hypothetical protein AXW37_06450 [Yersinia ruckeri]|uniref:hypothetical protein n=1 Tax=Yersinia ruckeri TaxID=29486 RepID=UPI0008FCF1DB|nr:hypothetical protein [Yersinia ruckeri]EKN4689899.1 hypothetical protein [Yersinia ruckeri]MCK8583812.1 hypothetical protein [Yersinia ruckeri]MCW6524298.1 hypothetical protein [Yersinia ruckeri]MCW6528482.1 hypothetical protein [Yersinia ruckeri]MCW6563413.1 hypothetical protein [Yersinia ruckeri]
MLPIIFDSKLARVARDAGDPNLLLQIQDTCRNKQAFCFSADDAVIVLRPRIKEGIPYVLVWLGISNGQQGLVKYTPEVQNLTRMIGGRWAEFYTARKGFIRMARRLGFERLADEGGLMKFKIPV